MKLRILHTPTMSLHTCILASFKVGLQTPLVSLSPLTNTCFVTPSWLLEPPLILRQPLSNPVMVLLTLHKHYRHHGFPSIIAYDSPIHWCLLLETNYLQLTAMILSGFSPTHRLLFFHQSSVVNLSRILIFVIFMSFCCWSQLMSDPQCPRWSHCVTTSPSQLWPIPGLHGHC